MYERMMQYLHVCRFSGQSARLCGATGRQNVRLPHAALHSNGIVGISIERYVHVWMMTMMMMMAVSISKMPAAIRADSKSS